MALTVAKPQPLPTITVGNNNGGFQGSTYNPQQTAPSTVLQNPVSASYLQPAASSRIFQNAAPSSVIQHVATAEEIAQAAEVQRQAVLAEIARQKKIAFDKKTGEITALTQKAAAGLQLSVSNAKATGKISIKQIKSPYHIVLPALTDYQKAYNEAYYAALDEVDKKKKANKTGLSAVWDKVSFGQDRRESSARAYAAKQMQDFVNKQADSYSKKVEQFTKDQAKRHAEVEATKFTSQEQLDAAIASYNDWETKSIAGLEHDRAAITGAYDAYGSASTAGLSSGAAHAVGWFNNKVVNSPVGKAVGEVWKYTLGSGSEDVPSLVTTPGRVVNWLGNINTKDRNINQYGGTTVNRTNDGKNAWQSTFNQRNWNLAPWVDKKLTTAQKEQMFGKQVDQDIANYKSLNNRKIGWTGAYGGPTAPLDPKMLDRNHYLDMYADDYNRYHKFKNSLAENVSDPLNLLTFGAGELGKSGKVSEFLDQARAGGKFSNTVEVLDKAIEIKNSIKTAIENQPVMKWLTSEATSAGQKLQDARNVLHTVETSAQKKFFAEINTVNKKIAEIGGHKLDTTVFKDLSELTDSEAKFLQRTVDGKLSASDRLLLAGKNNAAFRDKIENLAQRWTDFSEQMREADAVTKTRFGAGKKLYSPNSYYGQVAEDNKSYNFFKRSKGRVQSAADFNRGAIDRWFGSKVDENLINDAHVAKLSVTRDRLLSKYDKEVSPARQAMLDAQKAADSPWQKVRSVVGAPTRAWKKAVLKFTPSWSVNNALYNTGATYFSAGGEGLIEQAKMLKPKYFRAAMDADRAKFGTNLGREIGTKSRLDKFYTGLEDWSRVASGRTLMKKGLDEEKALKKVNQYFGAYTTRNVERPLKTLYPFYNFQKTLTSAAIHMPFDRPSAAIAFNRLDRYQKGQYDTEFNTKVAPQLKQLGYSDQEISDIKAQNAKYFGGRLKVGNKWITTPFNAFTQDKFEGISTNPWLQAGGETATGKDRFGLPLAGTDSTWQQRLISKFPQLKIANEAIRTATHQAGKISWIGTPGSEGYGLPKEKQGANKSLPNYDPKLDPGAKTTQDVAAFFGVPRALQFDTNALVQAKKLQKVTSDYFALDTSKMSYTDAEAARQAIFKKYGMTSDDFYKGILAKYDNPTSTRIKDLKNKAADANKKLFDEYGQQPLGTRNQWAVNKLRELNSQGYFNDNPFLKSFDWINPAKVAKADKQTAYQQGTHKSSPYTYQGKYFKTAESRQRYIDHATREQFTADGKFFKTAASRDAYIAYNSPKSAFWRKYFALPAAGRRTLIAANPQFNDRANWTQADWDAYNAAQKAKQHAKLASWNGGDTGRAINQHIAEQLLKAGEFTNIRASKRRTPSAKWALKA